MYILKIKIWIFQQGKQNVVFLSSEKMGIVSLLGASKNDDQHRGSNLPR